MPSSLSIQQSTSKEVGLTAKGLDAIKRSEKSFVIVLLKIFPRCCQIEESHPITWILDCPRLMCCSQIGTSKMLPPFTIEEFAILLKVEFVYKMGNCFGWCRMIPIRTQPHVFVRILIGRMKTERCSMISSIVVYHFVLCEAIDDCCCLLAFVFSDVGTYIHSPVSATFAAGYYT